MEFTEALEEIKKYAVKKLADKGVELTAEVVEVSKNNNVRYHGLAFRGEKKIQPVIYIDLYAIALASGETSVDEAAESVAETYLKHAPGDDLDVPDFTDYEAVKDRIVCCVQNRKQNEQSLKDVPHRELEDLAVYYRITLKDEQSGEFASAVVNNKLLDAWKVGIEELHAKAMENMQRLFPPHLQTMEDLVNELKEDCDDKNLLEPGMTKMYVLSNRVRQYGAAYIADKEELKRSADIVGDDLVILPSSIHELILLPAAATESYDELKEMVHEVNRDCVAREERLSDNIYLFSRESESLRICA